MPDSNFGGSSLSDTAHHLKELLEVDLTVAVLIDLGDRLVKLSLRVDISELLASQQLEQFGRIDLPAIVRVEHLEGRLEVCLPQERRCVHSRSQELYSTNSSQSQSHFLFWILTGVVDGARCISVGALQDLNELVAILTITQTMLQLFQTDGTVAIAVERLEDILELLDIVGVGLHGDGHQGDLLDLFRLLELFEVADVEAVDCSLGLLSAFVRVRGQPSMLESLVGCESSLRPRDQLVNQVLSLSSDLVPLLTIVIEGAASDHLQDFLVIVSVEGRISAEQNVEHAPRGPHIAADVVVTGQDLRRDVVWCAGTSLHSMQFASFHDLRQAEINNLQISIRVRAHEKEVLWLEITMDDVHAMAIIESLQDLFENFGGDLL